MAALPSNRLTYLCLCLCASLSSPMQMVRRCIMAERLRECCPNSRVPASPAATCTCSLPCTTALLCSRPHPGTLHTWCKGRLTRPRHRRTTARTMWGSYKSCQPDCHTATLPDSTHMPYLLLSLARALDPPLTGPRLPGCTGFVTLLTLAHTTLAQSHVPYSTVLGSYALKYCISAHS
jgi:hypothetical protein